MPFGGKYQKTPIQAMVHKIPVEREKHRPAPSWPGAITLYSGKKPHHGAYLAVVESVTKLLPPGLSIRTYT
jgi:phosphoribosylformylglycinamidine synthase